MVFQNYIKNQPSPDIEIRQGPDYKTGRTKVSGIVIDSTTWEPMVGAYVKLQKGGITIETAITDENGEFTFSKPSDSIQDMILNCRYIGNDVYQAPIRPGTRQVVRMNGPVSFTTGMIICERPTLKTRIKWFFKRFGAEN